MSALDVRERHVLEELEGIVGRGITTFIEVGRALAEIRDRRLYRDSQDTFEAYCRELWELGRTRAYQLIDAAAVSTTVDIDPPRNEAQARELVPLKADEAEVVEAWRAARAEAEEHGVALTAKIVRDAAQKRLARVQRQRQVAEHRERHAQSRCDRCRRSPRELEDDGVPLASGWFSTLEDGASIHECSECHTQRLRQERAELERQGRLGDAHAELQEKRAREGGEDDTEKATSTYEIDTPQQRRNAEKAAERFWKLVCSQSTAARADHLVLQNLERALVLFTDEEVADAIDMLEKGIAETKAIVRELRRYREGRGT